MVTTSNDDADVFKAIADPTRRQILSMLRPGGQSVNAIADHFPVSRPAISKHLRLLKEANLVIDIIEGRHHVYYVNAEPLEEVDRWLSDYRSLWKARWRSRLQRLKKHFENDEQGNK